MSDKPNCLYCGHAEVCGYRKATSDFWEAHARGHAGLLLECIAGMCKKWEIRK